MQSKGNSEKKTTPMEFEVIMKARDENNMPMDVFFESKECYQRFIPGEQNESTSIKLIDEKTNQGRMFFFDNEESLQHWTKTELIFLPPTENKREHDIYDDIVTPKKLKHSD